MAASNLISIMGLYESFYHNKKDSGFAVLAAFMWPFICDIFVFIGYIIGWIIEIIITKKTSMSAQVANANKRQQIFLLLCQKKTIVIVFFLLLLIGFFHSTLSMLLLTGLKWIADFTLRFVFWVLELC
jgi:hypothetical protein